MSMCYHSFVLHFFYKTVDISGQTSSFTVFLFVASPIVAFETPGFEVVVLIKATTASVDEKYFSSTIIPLIENISKPLIFPEDVSPTKKEFARISVSVGGNSNSWPVVPLRNQSRSEFLASLYKLKLADAQGTVSVGNAGAVESAVKTIYDSSVSITRMIILLTDEVLTSDSESDYAKRMLSVTDTLVVIIGIPSFQNPTFNASMPAAIKLAGQSYGVFVSIDAALTEAFSIRSIMYILMDSAVRICRRIAFVYENSRYVDQTLQQEFITSVHQLTKYFSAFDGMALSSYGDIMTGQFTFLSQQQVQQWDVKPSDSYDPVIGYNGTNAYDKLIEVSQTPDFPYLDIVLLTQADAFSKNTTYSMLDLSNQPNVNVFVFDASQNPSGSSVLQLLTNGRINRIYNVREPHDSIDRIYADHIYPTVSTQNCDGVATSSTAPSGPTTAPPNTASSATESSTVQTITTSTNAGHTAQLSVGFAVSVVLLTFLTHNQ